MKWVTRARPKIDRIACPWLVTRFIDEAPEFLYVPAGEVLKVAADTGAIPYDVPNVELGHHGDRCSFDAFIDKYELDAPALNKLALIVRAADCGQPQLAKEASGLLAISQGLSLNFADDQTFIREIVEAYAAEAGISTRFSTTFFQRADSCCWKVVNCSGVLPTISKPTSTKRCWMAGSFKAAMSAPCSFFFTSALNPLGAATPCHE